MISFKFYFIYNNIFTVGKLTKLNNVYLWFNKLKEINKIKNIYLKNIRVKNNIC